MMKTSGMIKHLLAVVTATFMLCGASSCEPEDDIAGIFVGKTWKLSNICNDKDAPLLSVDEVNQVNVGGHYVITFADGTFSAVATDTHFEGTWSAENDGNTFSINITNTVGTEASSLGNRFITMLRDSRHYEGDYNSLQLYGEDKSEYLLFRPL